MLTKNKKGNWLWILGLGILYSCPLFSQQSAGHTVTIRIVRPNVFSVKPAVSVSSQIEKETIQMEWQAGKRPKKITATVIPGSHPIVLEAREIGEKWILTPNDEKEILHLQSPSIGNAEWMCKIKPVQAEFEKTPHTILYTMAEM